MVTETNSRIKTLAIVQARMNSTRLPGKIMLPLAGEPVIKLVLERVKRAKQLDAVVLATGEGTENDVLADVAATVGVAVFRGDEINVFKRFYDCLRGYPHVTTVVRVCADNPLICPEVIDFLVKEHCDKGTDYCGTTTENGWPDGVGCGVAKREVFDRLSTLELTAEEREHCLLHVWNNPGRFSVDYPPTPVPTRSAPSVKLGLDTAEDYARLRSLMGNEAFHSIRHWSLADIMDRCERVVTGGSNGD